ncbi:hypothetical protein CLOSYM_03986 [[Clostridium] symbiosum ATCC 14940]|uniref:Uncharacterized protein n=1 Tax=[Clostridium] symbiosum ATCC 14940 TaxID=411472 RepID=A0ABC9TSX0_CLOSY|nr:hypothetical protein CLOSYM_03986 [[Clostridium] symbiosum ATCC 14940]
MNVKIPGITASLFREFILPHYGALADPCGMEGHCRTGKPYRAAEPVSKAC